MDQVERLMLVASGDELARTSGSSLQVRWLQTPCIAARCTCCWLLRGAPAPAHSTAGALHEAVQPHQLAWPASQQACVLVQPWTAERTQYLGNAIQSMLRSYTDTAVNLTTGLLGFISRFAIQVWTAALQPRRSALGKVVGRKFTSPCAQSRCALHQQFSVLPARRWG